ncbi:hypothetical protein CVU37_10205 [candidate division BRC1 bacterium HGW-BRC1-1]|jgi:tetratricopeptide (TPR) repeat protein|nr:MAG: hypothetical protein CVU37_10205 [candidate division BRC1 bacterium HGW-BRC1-1]
MDNFEAGFQEFLLPSRLDALADYLMRNLHALELPSRAEYRSMLAWTLVSLGRTDEAALHCEQAVRENPACLRLRSSAARFFTMFQPDMERARELLEILPLEKSHHSDAFEKHGYWAFLGAVLCLQGDVARGLEKLHAAYSAEMSRAVRRPDIAPLLLLRQQKSVLNDDDWQHLLNMVSKFDEVDMDALRKE